MLLVVVAIVVALPNGHVLVEVSPDRYGLLGDPLERATQMITDIQSQELIDGELLAGAVRVTSGHIVDVSKSCVDTSVRAPQAVR